MAINNHSTQNIEFSWNDVDANLTNASKKVVISTLKYSGNNGAMNKVLLITKTYESNEGVSLTKSNGSTQDTNNKNRRYKPTKSANIYECGTCGRAFRKKYVLIRHLPTHTDERNYVCKVCHKGFRQLATLARHRYTHSNVNKPFKCEVCSKSFSRISALTSHQKIHQPEKSFECSVCKKGFHQKGNLRNHMFTHTNARPYRCDLCDVGYNQQSNLVYHIKKMHALSDLMVSDIHLASRETCDEVFTRQQQSLEDDLQISYYDSNTNRTQTVDLADYIHIPADYTDK